jgi:hypothetical protein
MLKELLAIVGFLLLLSSIMSCFIMLEKKVNNQRTNVFELIEQTNEINRSIS